MPTFQNPELTPNMRALNNIYIPPIKCQGIKSKLIPLIQANVCLDKNAVWYEPFMGSGVVGFNIAPDFGRFSDANPHIINFYNALKDSRITPNIVKGHLEEEGAELLSTGERHYYYVRERFNAEHNPLDFIFLSRACFNGMIRFNKSGNFNVPFCRKPNRFSKSYITKIYNQIDRLWKTMNHTDWTFECLPFEQAVPQAGENDFIYCDPPYLGRHVDYFDSWSESDERLLFSLLAETKAKFILSTWHSNVYRENPMINDLWSRFRLITKEHFYHVGGKEENRNTMLEALVMNYSPLKKDLESRKSKQLSLYIEKAAGTGY